MKPPRPEPRIEAPRSKGQKALEGELKITDDVLGNLEDALSSLYGRLELDDEIPDAVTLRLKQKIGALRHLRRDLAELPALRP